MVLEHVADSGPFVKKYRNILVGCIGGERVVAANRLVVLVTAGLLGIGAVLWAVVPMAAMPPMPQAMSAERLYSIADRGGVSLITSGIDSPEPSVTYTRIQPTPGSTTPSGIGIFGFRNPGGELLTETGISASPLLTSGRVFVTFTTNVLNTGLAIVNPNDEEVRIDFFFSDSRRDPIDSGHGSFTIGANQQTARFISEPPFNAATATRGALTLTATLPVSVVALRQSIASTGDFVFSSMPVADLSVTSTETVFLPHFVTGGLWTSRLILVNPTDETITGRIGFISQGSILPVSPGVTTPIPLNGSTQAPQEYSLSARGFIEFATTDPSPFVQVGSFRVVPDEGNIAPITQVVIATLDSSLTTISEATVPPSETGNAFRLYVESSGELGSVGFVQSGIAIVNIAFDPTTVTLELTGLDGSVIAVTEIVIPASGQQALFLNQAFEATPLPSPLKGVLRVSSPDTIAVVGIRNRMNERMNILFTTTPATNEGRASTTAETFFSHLVDGGGWTTQTILFSGIAGQMADGVMRFFGVDGEPFDIDLE